MVGAQKLSTQCCPPSAKQHSVCTEKQNIFSKNAWKSMEHGTKGFKATAANMWWMPGRETDCCSVKQERAFPAPLPLWDGQGLTRASWRELLSVKRNNGTCDLNGSETAAGWEGDRKAKEKPRAFAPLGRVWWRSWWCHRLRGINTGRCQAKDKACARCG